MYTQSGIVQGPTEKLAAKKTLAAAYLRERAMTDNSKQLTRRRFIQRSGAAGFVVSSAGLLLPQAGYGSTPNSGGHFVIGVVGGESSDTLDPALSLGSANSYALYAFGDYLVEITPDGGLAPALAESWEATEGGKVWHFRIRQGVEFHNGKTLTPEDVLKTMQRHSNEDSKSGALGIMRGVESMAIDGDVISMTLTTPNADLPYLMTDYHLVIQPNGGMENPADGIGTGPFKLTAEEPGVRYTFEKFANHWNDSVGHYDTHEIIIINDDTARVAALQSGQVHAIDNVPPRIADRVANAPGVSVGFTSGPGHYIFVMHTDTPPFDNNDLRLALKYAINRQQMVDTILNGYGSVGNDTPINDAYPLFDETLEQREFSLEKAAEHYRLSGHDGSPIILRVSDAAFPGAIDAAQLFQQTAQAAGIPLELKREPADGYWSEVWNKQPFCASFWGGRPVQDQMWSTGYLSTADWNDTRFKNPEFDALLLEARAELDQAKRKELYGRMARIVWEEGGIINPMFNQKIDAHSDKIGGWVPHYTQMVNGFASRLTWFA